MEQFVIELIGFVYINSCSISLTFPIAGNLNIPPILLYKTPVYKNPSDGYRDSLPNGISNYRSDSCNKEKIHNLRYGYQIRFDKATHKYEGPVCSVRQHIGSAIRVVVAPLLEI